MGRPLADHGGRVRSSGRVCTDRIRAAWKDSMRSRRRTTPGNRRRVPRRPLALPLLAIVYAAAFVLPGTGLPGPRVATGSDGARTLATRFAGSCGGACCSTPGACTMCGRGDPAGPAGESRANASCALSSPCTPRPAPLHAASTAPVDPVIPMLAGADLPPAPSRRARVHPRPPWAGVIRAVDPPPPRLSLPRA